MDQQTLGYILLGAAALIIALLILLLVRSKKPKIMTFPPGSSACKAIWSIRCRPIFLRSAST